MSGRTVALVSGGIGAVVLVGALAVFVGARSDPAPRAVSIVSYAEEPDGRTLRVRYPTGDGTCVRAAGVVVVSETPSEVRLRARVRHVRTGRETVCTLVARVDTAEVRLTDEVGKRPVVDDSTGEQVVPTTGHDWGAG